MVLQPQSDALMGVSAFESGLCKFRSRADAALKQKTRGFDRSATEDDFLGSKHFEFIALGLDHDSDDPIRVEDQSFGHRIREDGNRLRMAL